MKTIELALPVPAATPPIRFRYLCPVQDCGKVTQSDRTLRHHVAKKHPGQKKKPGPKATLTDAQRRKNRKDLDKAAWQRRKAAQAKKKSDAELLGLGEPKPQEDKIIPPI